MRCHALSPAVSSKGFVSILTHYKHTHTLCLCILTELKCKCIWYLCVSIFVRFERADSAAWLAKPFVLCMAAMSHYLLSSPLLRAKGEIHMLLRKLVGKEMSAESRAFVKNPEMHCIGNVTFKYSYTHLLINLSI